MRKQKKRVTPTSKRVRADATNLKLSGRSGRSVGSLAFFIWVNLSRLAD
jgi:hypothetical protein